MRNLNLPRGSTIAINGYTCYAVYKAVVDAGFKPEYLDITSGDLNFSANALKLALAKNLNIKVVIIQNTLGYVCEMENINEICKAQGLILIEDLAHSVGAMYKNGKEAGTVGDLVVLSFSQDEIIDAVSGGALIVRDNKYQNFGNFEQLPISGKQKLIDRLYPLATFKIRKTYCIGLGKAMHFFYKKLNLLPEPMGGLDKIVLHKLPGFHSALAYYQFLELKKNLEHRKRVALAYGQYLTPAVLLPGIRSGISHSTNLRFPIVVNDRKKLIGYLKSQNIHISDIWYDAPVAPAKYLPLTDYKAQCPVAEKVSAQMLNLPTHINCSLSDAKSIAEKINQWLKSQ